MANVLLSALIMNPKFTPLDCDDDVVFLERDTFKVSKLKELCEQEIREKLNSHFYKSNDFFSESESFSSFFNHISLGTESVIFNEIKFNSIKDCRVLKISGKGWQKGKLKIQICREYSNGTYHKVCLEFCPDEPMEQESPLDDIRKLVEK